MAITAHRSKAPVENGVTIRDSRRKRDRARASPFNRAMGALSKRGFHHRHGSRESSRRFVRRAPGALFFEPARLRAVEIEDATGHNDHARAFPAAYL